MNGAKPANDVCAVVVTFQPDDGLAARVAKLRGQAAQVVLVDNGSSSTGRARVEALRSHPNVSLIMNAENRGLAAALNQGVERALQMGFQWIATFDQDSTVSPGYFETLFRAYNACPERERVGILAPMLRFGDIGVTHTFTYSRYRDHELYSMVRMSVTSGNLIPARLFVEVGTYREDFFIDYIDQEFCLRCRKYGWLILEAHEAILDHRHGQPVRRRFLWKQTLVTNHAAPRRYYQTRNRLVVYRCHGGFDWRWQVRDFWEFFRDTTKVLLFEEDKRAKLHATLRGVWHALTGQMGPLR